MMLDPCGVGRALVSRNVSSLNPNLALRNVALDKCLFAPFTELNAMRWSGRARLEWSAELRKSLESVKYGNQSYPRVIPPPVPDPVAARPFLPDTLKRITIKRMLDGRHPSQTWRSRPVVQGFLPSEWALLRNLEYLDLSDETGQGLIEGPIPSTWLMMTKLRTINLTGHVNFCKDWHRIVSYQIQAFAQETPYGAVWGLHKRYYGPIDWTDKKFQWNITVFDMDGAGWQWYDESTGEAGYTAVIAPDGKCCWDIFSDQFAARNYTLEGPSDTSGAWDYYGVSYERAQLYKAVLRFILSGDTRFWSRPEVATRIGFGTAPWRCVNNCQAQYYPSALECAPDCTTQTYCEPGGAALSDPNTTCCALSLLDQSYSFSHPPNATTPDWCSTYPACSLRHTPAWHHPSIDLTRPPEFSLVDDLVCLPLEEIYFEDVSFRPEHELLAVIPDRSGPDGSTFDL
ncbi:hypothetical protein PLESTF_001173600 [Pleodorina starrii]|nr:hypothetical protein PLESTF_001173600 [Pleodorina starrii]